MNVSFPSVFKAYMNAVISAFIHILSLNVSFPSVFKAYMNAVISAFSLSGSEGND